MERKNNPISRIYLEEQHKRHSFTNLNREINEKQQRIGTRNTSIYKQTNSYKTGEQEVSTFKNAPIDQEPKQRKIQRMQLKSTKTGKETEEESDIIWKRLDEIIKRIKFKKYIRAFLSLSSLRLQRQLTPQQILKINDSSYWISALSNSSGIEFNQVKKSDDERQKTSIVQFIKEINIPIFLPHHFLYESWQFLKICSSMICFFCYLLCFSLDQDLEQLFPIQMLVICQVFIVIDIFVTLNTGIYIKGILCKDRRELFNYYKSSKTIYYDITSTFFTTLYYIIHFNGVKSSQSAMVLLLPILFKHNDFYLIIKKLKQKFLLDRRSQNIIELINLLKNILVISHIFACIWLWVGLKSQQLYSDSQDSNSGQSSSSLPHSWLELVSVQQEDWIIQYLNSYYFIAVTMSTVGYGDIRPTNPIEVFVAVFFVMTCSVIFGFTLNSIGEIYQDFFQFEKQIQEKRYIIANYMDKNCINQKTRKSIFEYLEYYWKDQINENTQAESNIISQLSDNLKEELLIQSNRLILKQNRVLRDNFSIEFLAKCIPIIQELRYTQNEVIIDQTVGNTDCSIYFVLFGEIEIIHGSNISSKNKDKNTLHSVSLLKRGDSFGEKSFFTGNKSCLNIRSKSYSKLLKIKREDFINILQGDQEQYEIFCSLNDKLTFSSDMSFLQLQCKSCQDNTHDVASCPYLHFIPRKLKIFGKNQISEPHSERNPSFVRRNFKQRALLSNSAVTQQCYDFFQDNFEEIMQFEEDYHTFNQFQMTKTNLVSDEENDVMLPKSLKDLHKLKQLTNGELLDSPSKKKLTSTRRLGFLLSTNLSNGINTREQIGQSLTNSMDEINQVNMNNIVSLITGTKRTQFTHEIDNNGAVYDKEQLDSDNFSENGCSSNQQSTEKQVSFARLQQLKKQMSKEINHVQFDVKQLKSEANVNVKQQKDQFHQFRQEYAEYDLFDGAFEKMATFTRYFPKSNYKNIIHSLQPQNKTQKLIPMKDSTNSQINRKINNRNLQSIINRELVSCRSLSRIKIKADTPNSKENTMIKSLNPPSQIGANNISITLKENTRQESFVCNSSFNHQFDQSNLDINPQIQQQYDDPNTPPRNENLIFKQGILSIGNIKNSHYNFGSIEVSSQSTVRCELE